jgi:hypothetical protein
MSSSSISSSSSRSSCDGLGKKSSRWSARNSCVLVGNVNGDTFGAAWVGNRLGLRNGLERVYDDAIGLDVAFCACFEISFRGRRWLEPPAPKPGADLCERELFALGAGNCLFCERIGVDKVVRGRMMEVGGPITEATAGVLGFGIGLLIDRNAACFSEKGFEDVNSGETPEQLNSI